MTAQHGTSCASGFCSLTVCARWQRPCSDWWSQRTEFCIAAAIPHAVQSFMRNPDQDLRSARCNGANAKHEVQHTFLEPMRMRV